MKRSEYYVGTGTIFNQDHVQMTPMHDFMQKGMQPFGIMFVDNCLAIFYIFPLIDFQITLLHGL